MIHIPLNSKWIQVDSAFGGLAVYRRSEIYNAEYTGIDHNNSEVCEHVAFHKTIRDNNGLIFINPMLINTTYTEHSKYKKSVLGILTLWVRFQAKTILEKLKK